MTIAAPQLAQVTRKPLMRSRGTRVGVVMRVFAVGLRLRYVKRNGSVCGKAGIMGMDESRPSPGCVSARSRVARMMPTTLGEFLADHAFAGEIMNAILKTAPRFESIYDHNVTAAELDALFDGYPEPMDEYFEGLGQDSLLVDVVHLYQLRQQPDKVQQYRQRIKNPLIRAEMLTPGCCAAHSAA